jgi:hypothetical protein
MSKGTVSINAENIMPVIKQWLYSDKDIFVRELVANGCDAIYLGGKQVNARAFAANFDNQQLAAVAWMTQSTASGQASEAGHAVRKAHSENRRQAGENE